MIRNQIEDIVKKAVASLQEAGELPAVDLPPVELEHPQVEAHGDYATTFALKLASAVSKSTGQKANPRACSSKRRRTSPPSSRPRVRLRSTACL